MNPLYLPLPYQDLTLPIESLGAADIGSPGVAKVATLADLAEQPSDLEALCVIDWSGDLSAVGRFKQLRYLVLGDPGESPAILTQRSNADLGPLLHALPLLDILRVRGGYGVRCSQGHAELRHLLFEGVTLAATTVDDLNAAEFPELSWLELWLGDPRAEADVGPDQIGPLLGTARYPKLERLAVRNTPFSDAVAMALSESPRLPTLAVLDLSGGTLGDDGLAALEPHLAELGVLFVHHNFATESTRERLKSLENVLGLDEQGDVSRFMGDTLRHLALPASESLSPPA